MTLKAHETLTCSTHETLKEPARLWFETLRDRLRAVFEAIEDEAMKDEAMKDGAMKDGAGPAPGRFTATPWDRHWAISIMS